YCQVRWISLPESVWQVTGCSGKNEISEMKTTIDINNDWRKVAAAIYKKPVDSKILGQVELDVTELEEYVAAKRKEGVKVTLTHIFTMAASRALRFEVPELNAYVSRGKIIQRKQVDAMVSLLMNGSEMGSVRVNNADQLTIEEFTALVSEGIKNARKGELDRTTDMKSRVAGIPWPFRVWVLRILKFFTITWGVSLRKLGLTTESFGSFIVSNIGTLGLDIGFPALMPISNVSFVLIIGAVVKKPWVVNDEIKIRKIITLGAALDHRVCDGSHGGRLFHYIKYISKHPQLLEGKP
ncbi:MAG TPA: 2-oxo acid dehydrogenase subunit E2, partial [Prolixibacteraceae bacterium]|nr:2-oxo acid dehydrogenase subunit E2 [Prolixibacteraceae bacterium]